MTTHEVLVAARNLIADEGWQQLRYDGGHGSGGPYCLTGAIQRVAPFDQSRSEEEQPWKLAQEIVTKRVGFYATCWNDRKGRTEDEVFAVLDACIAQTAPEPSVDFLTDVREPVTA